MNHIAMGTGLLFAIAVSGCQPSLSAWEHYDACSATNSSFAAMVDCGKAKRMAACASDCSSSGNAFVQYADSLKISVQRKELSEPEATRKLLEYRNSVEGKLALEASAYRPTSVTCSTVGNITNCF